MNLPTQVRDYSTNPWISFQGRLLRLLVRCRLLPPVIIRGTTIYTRKNWAGISVTSDGRPHTKPAAVELDCTHGAIIQDNMIIGEDYS